MAGTAMAATAGTAMDQAHTVMDPGYSRGLLAAIVTSAESSVRWLNRPAPDIEEVRAAVGQIVKDAHRAGEGIRRIRQFSTKSNPAMIRLAITEAVEERYTAPV